MGGRRMSNIFRSDNEINKIKDAENITEIAEIKELNTEIKQIFAAIFHEDSIIRKDISNELKAVRQKLNRPEERTNVINIKA